MQVTWIDRAKELEKSGDDYEKIAKKFTKEGQRSARNKPISANMVSKALVAQGVRRRAAPCKTPKAKTATATKKPNPSISALVGAIIGFALAILLAFLFASPSFAAEIETVSGPRATGYLGHLLGAEPIEYDDSLPVRELPDAYDARSEFSFPPVRDQEDCGSCWAFAAVRAFEIARAKEDSNAAIDLSEQDMVSCERSAAKCQGGYMESASFLTYGITSEAIWPYAATSARCKKTEKVAKASKIWLLGTSTASPRIEEIKSAIYLHGSVFVTVAANSSGWSGKTGEITGRGCAKNQTNHMVVLVGWTADGKWILSNSWGKGWATDGYTLIPFGCARVAEEAGYVVPGDL